MVHIERRHHAPDPKRKPCTNREDGQSSNDGVAPDFENVGAERGGESEEW